MYLTKQDIKRAIKESKERGVSIGQILEDYLFEDSVDKINDISPTLDLNLFFNGSISKLCAIELAMSLKR